MGYHTYFTLVREDGGLFTDGMIAAIEDLEVFDTIAEEVATGGAKWYTYANDMEDFSKLFPGVVFCLHGEGEEQSDLWNEYYLDGKSQRCEAEIIYPPYDPSKLA